MRRLSSALASFGIEAVAGIASGAIGSWDTDRWEANAKNTSQTPSVPLSFAEDHNLWLGTGLVAIGGAMAAFGWPHPDVVNPTVGAGALLLGQRVTQGIAQRGNKGFQCAPPATGTGTGTGTRISSPRSAALEAPRPRHGAAAYLADTVPAVL